MELALIQNWQYRGSNSRQAVFSILSVLAGIHTVADRITKLILITAMTVKYKLLEYYGGAVGLIYAYGAFVDIDSGGSWLSTYTTPGITTYTSTDKAGTIATMYADIVTKAGTLGYSTFTVADIQDFQSGYAATWDMVFSNPSRSVNTAYQVANHTFVSASVDITASLSLITGQEGKVELKYADDSGFTTNVKTVQPFSNGNTGTLTLGLALGQKVTATVSGWVPAGKYYKIVTTNVTGTPTFGSPVVQEVY